MNIPKLDKTTRSREFKMPPVYIRDGLEEFMDKNSLSECENNKYKILY